MVLLHARRKKTKAEVPKKHIDLVNPEPFNMSKNTSVREGPTREEKIANSVLRSYSGLAAEIESRILSWVKKQMSELRRFGAENIPLSMGSAEVFKVWSIHWEMNSERSALSVSSAIPGKVCCAFHQWNRKCGNVNL